MWSVPALTQGQVLTLNRPLWLTEVKIPSHVWRLQNEEAVVNTCGFCPVLFLKLKRKKKAETHCHSIARSDLDKVWAQSCGWLAGVTGWAGENSLQSRVRGALWCPQQRRPLCLPWGGCCPFSGHPHSGCEVGPSSALQMRKLRPGTTHWPKVTSSVSGEVGV